MKFGMGKRAQFFPKPGDRPKDEFPRSQVYTYLQVYDALTKVPNDHALAMAYNTEIDPMIGQPRAHPGYLFWEYFPIAPNNVRPPQNLLAGARVE